MNVCTDANRDGVYELKVRFEWPNLLSQGELTRYGFGSLEQLHGFLVVERHGTVETP